MSHAVARPLDIEALRRGFLRALMVGPVRALDLIKRMPHEFKARGWPPDEEGIAVVACACGAVRLSAGDQRFRLPPGLLKHDAWFAFARRCGGGTGTVTAMEIVENMELWPLTEPV